jgi:predicted DNA-binding protein
VADMRQKRKLTEEEIDRLVIAEANDTSKWGKPIAVKPTSIRFSPSIIEKAKYFAKLHKTRGYQTWLKQIVEERIKLEEKFLSDFKREIKTASK